jgi:hypothetical protein
VEAEGFQVIDLGDEAGRAGRREQVIAALALLRSCDPRRFERMKHGSRRIAIFSTVGSSGEHWTSPWLIVLNSRFVLESSPEEIALVLIHEATHARLKKVGIGYDEEIRHRVERVCVNQEKAFAERLGNPEEWLELISRKSLDPQFWSNAAKSARREKAFEDLVMPPCRDI